MPTHARLRQRHSTLPCADFERSFYWKHVLYGEPLCEVARSSAADIDKALDAAHAAKDAWGHTAPSVRAKVLNQIADRMEKNLEQRHGSLNILWNWSGVMASIGPYSYTRSC